MAPPVGVRVSCVPLTPPNPPPAAHSAQRDEQFYFGKSRAASAGKSFKLRVGDVVSGVVLSVKPYGAFVDVGGATGLLHVSEISTEYVVDVSDILSEGDQLKVMILMEDREQGRLTLTTKRLERTPGDMVRNPQLVFDGAEEMAKLFRARMESIAMGADTMSMDELLGSRDGYEPMPFLPSSSPQVVTSRDATLYKF
ncbi:MAG: hypothetical protein WDW36_009934 [Sanguina aurantia]